MIRLGNRLGDNAEMAMIELVDFNEIYSPKAPAKKKATRRRGKSTKAEEAVVDAPVEEASEEKESNE